jgi:hypothetical protein
MVFAVGIAIVNMLAGHIYGYISAHVKFIADAKNDDLPNPRPAPGWTPNELTALV